MVIFGVPTRHSEKRKELGRRRRRGARLLAAGHPQAEVARQVDVSRQTVMRCERLRQQGGLEALRRGEHFGRPERLSESQREELVRLLKAGSLAAGFATELWTLVSFVPLRARQKARHGGRRRVHAILRLHRIKLYRIVY